MNTDLIQHLTKKASDSGLSHEQVQVVYDVVASSNLFVTGVAGTGKTHLLNFLCGELTLALTASTGISALHIRGQTIHSWAGLGVGDRSAAWIVEDLETKKERYRDQTLDRIVRAQRLVIDEASMLSGELLDLLSDVLKRVRGCPDEAFGGIQVILVGDVCQLPPVSKGKNKATLFFDSDAWHEGAFKIHVLTHVYRQESDYFARVLGKIRVGDVDEEVQEFLQSRSEAEDPDPERPPCILHTRNRPVDVINRRMLAQLPGAERTFTAENRAKHAGYARTLNKNCLAPNELTLKLGARVMLLRNINLAEGLANGSMGAVVSLAPLRVQFDNGLLWDAKQVKWEHLKGDSVLASREQYPLRLAWAITVHKSQGMTLDKVDAHLSNAFETGMAYVAMSRARSAEGLFLSGDGVDISASERAVAFYTQEI